MIGCDAGYISAFLDQDVARGMFPDLLSARGAPDPDRNRNCSAGGTASTDWYSSMAEVVAEASLT
jgi:hypothetical protein